MNISLIVDRILEMLQYGLLACFGAVGNYLYATIGQGRPFVWKMFAANIIIAFVVGNMAGEFIADDYEYRDGVLMACGYCTFPLLAMFETLFMARITEYLRNFKIIK